MVVSAPCLIGVQSAATRGLGTVLAFAAGTDAVALVGHKNGTVPLCAIAVRLIPNL